MAKKSKSNPTVEVATFQGINSIGADRLAEGCKPTDLYTFMQEHAGGNPRNVGIRMINGVTADKPFPFETTMFDKDTGEPNHQRRGLVMWALINGNGAAHYTLFDCQQDHRSIKSPAQGVKGLIDVLNGGQSRNKKTWGQSYAELYVIPA